MTAALKVDPARLPVPRLSPSLPCRIDIDGMGRPYSRERTPVETFEELHHRSRHHPGGMWTSARDAVVIEMARSGERCEKIADELGISKSAVYKRIRRLRKAGEEI